MRETPVCTVADAIYKLAAGNLKYLNAENGSGDISRRIRMSTWAKGQSPYAIIVTCSDSRVIPENIFSAGIGELFVIRLAGNVIDDHQLGSIEYAAGHLGCRLVVVLGHTHCGAVDAAINYEPSGYIRYITDEIKKAIGDETDPYKASCLNVRHSVQEIERACASITSRRKRACGSSVRCTTSRTAASNSCKELPALRRNGPFPDRERAVSCV